MRVDGWQYHSLTHPELHWGDLGWLLHCQTGLTLFVGHPEKDYDQNGPHRPGKQAQSTLDVVMSPWGVRGPMFMVLRRFVDLLLKAIY